jgi:exopolysaccharide biosynthesis polyprenyl glycosylphosphotransferase
MPSESTRDLEPAQYDFVCLSGATHSPRHAARTFRRPILAQMVAFLVSDLLCFAAVFVGSEALAASWRRPGATSSTLAAVTASFALLLLVLLSHLGRGAHYTRRLSDAVVLRGVVAASVLAMLCDALLHVGPLRAHDTTIDLLRWLCLPPLLLWTRACARSVLRNLDCWDLRALLIGDPASAAGAAGLVAAEAHLGYVIAGACTRCSLGGDSGLLAPLRRTLAALRADCVLLLGPRTEIARDVPLLAALTRAGIPYAVLDACALGPQAGRLTYENTAPHRAGGAAMKRGSDVVLASLLLLALAPLLCAIALLVRQDGGPVFYRQVRVGEGGRLFQCVKFRSMLANGDGLLAELLARDPAVAAEWAAAYKLARDPRVTPLGRVLRRTSLDELPQLFNVLRGEMSLVGPRPVVPSELSKYGGATDFYLAVRPGLTGLWQVSGRSDTTYEQRVRLDAWYVQHRSSWLDLTILLRTAPAVLLRRGAV